MQLALVAGISCAIFILLIHPVALRTGLVDHPHGRKKHDGTIPLIGGLAIYIALVVSHLAFNVVPVEVLVAAGVLVFIGIIDDVMDVAARIKLFVQIGAAIYVCVVGDICVESLGSLSGGSEIFLGSLSIPFTVFAIVGLINAINMIDGIDGLAGGLSLFTIAGLTGSVWLLTGKPPVEAMAIMALISAISVFLVFNFGLIPGKKIFLGDAGSTLLGLLLAYLLIRYSQPQFEKPVLPASLVPWLVAIPVLDTLSLIWRRIRQGKSPFAPGRDHIHHLIMETGLSARQTLGVIVVLALGLLLLGYGVVWLHPIFSGIVFGLAIPIYLNLVARRTNRKA